MIRYLFLAGLLLFGYIVKGQAPVANFSATTQKGCAALQVSFTDNSTGDPKFWNWDFGNGQLSNIQNPTIVYYAPGVYTVKLVVRNGTGTNGITKTDYITVFQSPFADFSSDFNNVCLPASIQFKDASVPNGGSITSWEWDFGDGSKSTLQNPSKVYNTVGFYNIALKVTSSTGCTNTNTKYRNIRVLSGVKANFVDPVTTVCLPPFNITYSNETSGPGNITYAWDFGNGNTSALKNPNISISAPGTYNVQLIARSDLGCGDTVRKAVIIKGANTAFTMPDSACLNIPVTFTNTSSPAPLSTNWNFGDGTSAQTLNAVKTFTRTGRYNVVLVNKYAECADSLNRTISILPPPAVDFSSNTQGACKGPLTVTFQDVSPDAVSWLWNFGDGGTSTQKNPQHVYSNAGEFDVTLTIQSRAGCKNTLTKSKWIRIVPPSVSISNAPAGGCVPFTFSPVAAVNSIEAVSSYLWDFGDGTPTSNLPNPSHTYPTRGNYTLKLTIITAGGCAASVTVANGVKTGTRPVVNFSANKDSVCAFGTVMFKDLSTASPGIVDAWEWDFGNGVPVTTQNPSFTFYDTGKVTIKLTAYSNGCAETITKPAFLYVYPPIAKFRDSSDCNNRLKVFFKDESITSNLFSPLIYLWEFGDPAKSTSNLAEPNFTYPALGNYTVKLTLTNGTPCGSNYSKVVSLYNEVADFTTAKTIYCKNERITLSAITSNPQNVSQYVWTINSGSPFVAPRNFDTTFAITGVYNISLTVVDKNGCVDSKSKTSVFSLIGPTADFISSFSVGCQNAIATFTDRSAPAGNIVKWTFDFGDGTTQSFTAPPFTHQFRNTGSFNVRMTVQDRSGCTDAVNLAGGMVITRPRVAFKASETMFCPGLPLQFTDSSTTFGVGTYLWNFGDGGTSTLKNPVHTYTGNDKVYTVSLKVQDSLGCSDSLAKINYVQVKSPKSLFTLKDSTTICPPLETKFFFAGRDYESFYWDFGDSIQSSLSDPTHFYNTYGTFKAKLFVVGMGGCIDSSEHTVEVSNPANTVISYSPIYACNEILVDFQVTRPPGTKYTFHFGDGTSIATTKDSLQHYYGSPSGYPPSLDLEDNQGCHVGVSGQNTIVVLGASPLFSVDRKTFCDSGTVYFTNFTIGNDPVVSSVWNFGDGNTSATNDAIHQYTAAGQYIASLNVVTQNGCSKSLTDTIRVYATPEPFFVSDSTVCINSTLSLKALLAQPDSLVKWNWNLGNGEVSTAQNPSVVYNKEGTYTISLEAINILGCKSTFTKNIVVTPIPVITVAEASIIPVGTGISIPVTYSPNTVLFKWTPAAGLSCSDCANPVANPKVTTTYNVSVTDNFGCSNSKDIPVTVVCNDKNYFVPNTFSPNGDGNNDIFFPRGNNINRVQSMRIFNRWGEVVFERRNFAANSQSDGWNGLYKGKIAGTDTYVYIVEFI
ncbi:MAG: PKD domain-containing protein, partial [Chitinophagaceae bacterium]